MGNAWVILGVEWNISQDNIGSDLVTGSHFHQRTHFTFWWNGSYQRITLSQILWLDQMYDWVTTGLQSFPTEPKKSKFQEDWCKNGHATRRKSQKRTLKTFFLTLSQILWLDHISKCTTGSLVCKAFPLSPHLAVPRGRYPILQPSLSPFDLFILSYFVTQIMLTTIRSEILLTFLSICLYPFDPISFSF